VGECHGQGQQQPKERQEEQEAETRQIQGNEISCEKVSDRMARNAINRFYTAE
jgi:hypothetical protein